MGDSGCLGDVGLWSGSDSEEKEPTFEQIACMHNPESHPQGLEPQTVTRFGPFASFSSKNINECRFMGVKS